MTLPTVPLAPDERVEVGALGPPDPPGHADGGDAANLVAPALESPVAKDERFAVRALAASASGAVVEATRYPDGAGRSDYAGRSGREIAIPVRRPFPWARRVAMGVALAGLVSAALLAVSASTASDRDRVSDLGGLAAYDVLPTAGASSGLGERLDAALRAVEGARRAPLSLFPSYDTAALDTAAADLARLVAVAAPHTVVSQEGRLALGRVRLYQGRDAEAARVLGSLVRQGGYRGPEARRLLDFLRAQNRR